MNMSTLRLVGTGALLAAGALLGGCGTERFARLAFWMNEPTEQQSPRLAGATQYTCDGNKRLAVRYGTAGQPVMVIFPEREFRLDPAPSGSGIRYTNGSTLLMSKGDEASLEEAGRPVLTNCRRVVAEK
ncbi:MAG: lysozyme inhibitor [Betaproteobacteria bacterium]|nr:lysozyme inhibitor [Betaproteobacteria bacterium]